MGSDKICEKIGHTDPSLIARRNIDGETPLFLAALYGERITFLRLHYLYVRSNQVSSTDFAHCIRDNNDTILHCVIAEGHFDVAIEIVHLYKDNLKEMMRRNNEGLTPLHLLAGQHSAFRTTALLDVPSLLHPIYWLWKVEEKKQATTFEEVQNFKYDTPGSNNKFMKNVLKVCFWPLRLPLFILSVLVLLLVSFQLLPEAAIERWDWNIPRMKEKHKRCYQIMTEFLQHASDEDMSQVISRSASKQFSDSLQSEEFNEPEEMEKPPSGTVTIETPLMIAVKNGVIEMVEKILELFPSTIKDVNGEGKNILLLAAEYRQEKVYWFLLIKNWRNESVLRKVDKEGNNALHLAAKHGEIDWFGFVNNTMPCAGLLGRYNRNMKTPEEMIRESYEKLMKSEADWVVKTSEACSVVSTLVVSVAFSTRTSVPGGYEGGNGYAVLRNNPSEFKTFRDSSFAALLFSLSSTICFLSIVAASRSLSAHHYWRYVPSKFYCGVYFMFASIVCLWISFCAADFFMLHDHTHKLNKALPTYILLAMGFILMVVKQLPTFVGPTLSSRFSRIASPRRKATGPIEYRRTNKKDTDLNNQN